LGSSDQSLNIANDFELDVVQLKVRGAEYYHKSASVLYEKKREESEASAIRPSARKKIWTLRVLFESKITAGASQ
jgi:hypothetical protein